MGKPTHQRLPRLDPVSGGELYISELANDDSGVTIRGRFALPRFAALDPEQERFLETFLRCRGVISAVEKELGISYPTVRGRLDALLQALNLAPVKERKARTIEEKRQILEQLEQGAITPEEAKARLKEEADQ